MSTYEVEYEVVLTNGIYFDFRSVCYAALAGFVNAIDMYPSNVHMYFEDISGEGAYNKLLLNPKIAYIALHPLHNINYNLDNLEESALAIAFNKPPTEEDKNLLYFLDGWWQRTLSRLPIFKKYIIVKRSTCFIKGGMPADLAQTYLQLHRCTAEYPYKVLAARVLINMGITEHVAVHAANCVADTEAFIDWASDSGHCHGWYDLFNEENLSVLGKETIDLSCRAIGHESKLNSTAIYCDEGRYIDYKKFSEKHNINEAAAAVKRYRSTFNITEKDVTNLAKLYRCLTNKVKV